MIQKTFITKSIKPFLKRVLQLILRKSLEKAAKQQGLKDLADKLTEIVPDITDQYSTFKVDNPYLEVNVRNLHAFQMSLVNLEGVERPVIVDIGDSAGTHLQYIVGLYSKKKNIKCLSVNLDIKAVEKIKRKGLEAVQARAEELHKYNVNPDILLCFETLEHLMDPCHFLHELSKTNAKYLIITAPYLRNSRVGLHHIRGRHKDIVHAENTHIFELSPKDLKLLVEHSGWKIMQEKIYLQYPKRGVFRITKALWERFDFEGFYGMILSRDDTWSSKYKDW